MQVKWRDKALADLDIIVRYIFQENPAAAFDIEDLILNGVQNLSQFPYLGRVGLVFGTRELVIHPNYIVVYRIDEPLVQIISVVHTRRQYPNV